MRPARLSEDLRNSPFAPVGVADPRLVDPHLQEVIAQAELEARARGFKAGYAAGRIAGHEEGLSRQEAQRKLDAQRQEDLRQEQAEYLDALAGQVRAGLEHVLATQVPVIEELRELVATMTVELAEALVGHHLTVGDCAARDAVLRALREVPRAARFQIRLNPGDIGLVKAMDTTLLDWDRAAVVADESVELGGAVVVAENLEVDAQMSLALARVKKALHP